MADFCIIITIVICDFWGLIIFYSLKIFFSFHRIYSSYYVYGRVCTACGHDGNTRGRCEFDL